ncbi:hypothetical protein DSECCO2_02250 [anaerobic digester metagenome]
MSAVPDAAEAPSTVTFPKYSAGSGGTALTVTITRQSRTASIAAGLSIRIPSIISSPKEAYFPDV